MNFSRGEITVFAIIMISLTLTLTASQFLSGETGIEVYFCRVQDCSSVVVEEIMNAEKSVYFMVYTFTDKNIADALHEKHLEGLKVSGVTEKFQNHEYSIYNYLKEKKVDITLDNNRDIMHHKVFLIDGETIITGSYNPTKGGNEKNDENMLVIKNEELAAEYHDEFKRVKS